MILFPFYLKQDVTAFNVKMEILQNIDLNKKILKFKGNLILFNLRNTYLVILFK